jgi:glutamate--cysteine ligase
VLDSLRDDHAYRDAVASAAAALNEPDRMPSARVLADLERSHDGSHTSFVQAWSQRAKTALAALPLAPDVLARFQRLAVASIEEQRRCEAADELTFEEFRRQYVSPERLVV